MCVIEDETSYIKRRGGIYAFHQWPLYSFLCSVFYMWESGHIFSNSLFSIPWKCQNSRLSSTERPKTRYTSMERCGVIFRHDSATGCSLTLPWTILLTDMCYRPMYTSYDVCIYSMRYKRLIPLVRTCRIHCVMNDRRPKWIRYSPILCRNNQILSGDFMSSFHLGPLPYLLDQNSISFL